MAKAWSKYYPLEEFIRHVLPYRLGDEPLEDWRESYYMHFANRVDSIYSGGDVIRKTQAVETIINRDGFQWNELFPSLPHLGPATSSVTAWAVAASHVTLPFTCLGP